MMWSHKRICTAALLGLLVSVAGCGSDGAEVSGRSQVTVLQAAPKGVGWATELAAVEKGAFDEEGVSVTMQETAGSGIATQQVLAGKADFALASPDAILIAATKDSSLRAVGCLYQRNIFGIAVPEGSPIGGMPDLRGKKIGIPEEGGGEAPLVDAALQTSGLMGDVEVATVGEAGPSVVRALKKGEVDAFAGGLSDFVSIQAGGVALRDITPARYRTLQAHCLLTTSDVLSKPDGEKTATALFRGLVRGALFAIDDEPATLDIVCDSSPVSCREERVARDYLSRVVDLIQPAGGGRLWSVNRSAWESTVEYLESSKATDKRPDIDTVIASPDVQKVRRGAYADYESLRPRRST